MRIDDPNKPLQPDIQRLQELDLLYAGEATPGVPRAVAGGTLLNHSGLPVLLPNKAVPTPAPSSPVLTGPIPT